MWTLKIGEGESGLRTSNGHTGRQTWHFDPDAGSAEERAAVEKARREFSENRFAKKHSADLLMRLQDFDRCNELGFLQYAKSNPLPRLPDPVKVKDQSELTEENVEATLKRGVLFYSTIQAEDGHWPGDYGGPMILMPKMVIVLYITGSLNVVLSRVHQEEMVRYVYNHQNEDGGWGLHIEGPSIMFGSVLNYVTLRLLGQELNNDGDQALERGRAWILQHGGATAIPSWGKFWLSVLGLFEWEGNNPLLPEFWLLPYFLPVHPGRMWCHCRMVYLAMSYLYGKKFTPEITKTALSMRKELFNVPYEDIDWNKGRNECAKEDLYCPLSIIQNFLWETLRKLVDPALMHWPEDPNSEAFKWHLPRIYDYLWIAEDGMKVQNNNGSQTWDAAFAVQALISTGLIETCGSMLKKAHYFLDRSQIQENFPGDLQFWHRHISKGGWGLSTRDHVWPVSDCTAEGFKAALALSQLPSNIVGESISAERFYDAVTVMLAYQTSCRMAMVEFPRMTQQSHILGWSYSTHLIHLAT
ncbi:hypothetical protein L7F22_023657 [Adiantum nelumboides]|nr:hypothetical protein [Adiantum nelumboides]